MTKEQFGEWRNHPATQFFRQFLRDRRNSLIQFYTEQWLNNTTLFKEDGDEARGHIDELFGIEALSFDQIEAFYKEKDNASEVTQDSTR